LSISRNDLCPCGSGKKYKRCHGAPLGGLTPREAASKASGRKKLDLLLRQMEHDESRLPAGERYDMNRITHVVLRAATDPDVCAVFHGTIETRSIVSWWRMRSTAAMRS
jgi:hypothetical protein